MALGRFRFTPSVPLTLRHRVGGRRWLGKCVPRVRPNRCLVAPFTPLKADAKELRLSHPLVRSGPNVPAACGKLRWQARLRTRPLDASL